MARLKLLVQLALVLGSAQMFLNANPAQAAGLTFDLGNKSNYIEDFSQTVVDDFGVSAILSGRLSTARGNVLLTAGGNFSGVVLNVTNLSLTAPSQSSLTFSSSPLLSVFNRFTFTFGPSVLAQQVFNGSFVDSLGNAVDSGNFANFTASTSGSNSTTSLNSGPLSTNATAPFRYTGASILPNTGALNNPTLTALLGPSQARPFFLSAGETLVLPSSACYVVTNSPTGQTLLDQISGPTAGQDAEAACLRAATPREESVPEPSAIAPLALLGLFGTTALLKRKQQFQQG